MPPCECVTASDRPNILLIYTDDQGDGDAPCLNAQSKFAPPNLAREGLTPTGGHCSGTVCTPSGYRSPTGRYGWCTRLGRGAFGAETTWKEHIKRFEHDSNGVFREGKRPIYGGGHRVPLIVRWPDLTRILK